MFNALLSPHFIEGSQLATQAAVEIPLPEDDPKAMSIICMVLHFRNNDVPNSLELEELLCITKLADKYDCIEALKHVARTWVRIDATNCDQEDLSILLMVAFYFGDKESCRSIGTTLVVKSGREIESPEGDYPNGLEKLFGSLECCTKLWSFTDFLQIRSRPRERICPTR